MVAEAAGGYDAVMDRAEWVSRVMHRVEELDVRLRPGELAELAGSPFESSAGALSERLAAEAGKGGVRRAD